MKILLLIGLFLMGSEACPEQVLELNQDLINREIASIMRSRGIEPFPGQRCALTSIILRACNSDNAKRSFAHDLFYFMHRCEKCQTIAGQYKLGFLYLSQGRIYDAVQIFQHIALSCPTTPEEEGYVKMALELASINVTHQVYPFARLPIIKPDADAQNFVIVPFLAPSSLLAAFLRG